MTYGLRSGAAVQGLAAGIMISILFSALPLLHIRHIKPNVLLRETSDSTRGARDYLRWGVAILVILGLLFLVSWQGGGVRVGLFFLGGLVVAAGALYLAATLLIFLVRRMRPLTSFSLKQAINSLHRPGNQTRVIVMIVGLGVFVVITVQSLQTNFLHELDRGRTGDIPDMFLIDIQTDQRQGVSDMISQTMGKPPLLVPTVRTRIVAVNGKDIDLSDEQKRDRGRLARDYVVTYRPNLESNESIVAGKFWDESPSSEPEVSLEESMRGLVRAGCGRRSHIRCKRAQDYRASVQAFVTLTGETRGRGSWFCSGPERSRTRLRCWSARSTARAGEVERSRFQRALVDKYPNVSVIDVADVVRAVERIINNITLAVSFVASFVVLTGGLVLIGSLAMTKFQRIYEVAILKTLGANRKVLLKILIAEYGLIGFVAGFIGSLAAVGLSYSISRWVFEIPWSFTPTVNFGGVGATMLLVTVVGTLATYDVLARKPLVTLRAQ